MEITKTVYVADRAAWRAWLEEHHETEKEIWLVHYKKHAGRPSLPYDDAVEEALCFGWIDSIVKKIDEEKYAQKYTPRRDTGRWSAPNRVRIRKLIADGKMTEAGLAKIDLAILDREPEPREVKVIPPFVRKGLKASPPAWENFQRLPPSHRRNYLLWIMDAKKQETRERRLKEAVGMLVQNKRLGIK